jgi:hypothetical protein
LNPFWRREKPLHQRLAEAGGIAVPGEAARDVAPWHQAGVHGVPRPRQFDAVVSLDIADVRADEIDFVALEDGTVLVDSDDDVDVEPFADALEDSISPPYRATAVRKGGTTFALAANAITVATIADDVDGDMVELAMRDGESTVRVDGAETSRSLPAFEHLAGDLDAYVVRASRLDGDLWEVQVAPL